MSLYKFGSLILDVERRVITRDGEPLQLGPKVVETLLALIERPGQIVTKAELLERIWPDAFVQEGTLAQHVCIARKALRKHGVDAIQTIARRGYRFTGAVVAVNRASTPVHHDAFWGKRFVGLAAAAVILIGAIFGSLHGVAGSHPKARALSATGARYYAIGRYYWNQRTKTGLHLAARYFRSVIRSDPHDARGYAGLAETYALEGDYGHGPLPYAKSYEVARTYARRALTVDPLSAEAHAALGISEDVPHTRRAAQSEFRMAIAIDPSNAAARQWYGESLLQDGRRKDALMQLRRAAQLDPLSVATLSWLSHAAYFSRNYDEAITSAREALELSPTRADAYIGLGLAYEMTGNYRQAEATFRRYARACPGTGADAAALLAHLYAKERDFRRAQSQLTIARSATGMRRADPLDLALAFVAVGKRPQALALMSEVRRESPILAEDPRLDPVRCDPRFRPYLQPVVFT